MRVIFFMLVCFGMLFSNDFSRNNGVVVDNLTHLEWQDDYSDNDSNVKETLLWIDAINYCEDLVLNKKSDWRLPNVNELFSLLKFNEDTSLFKSIGSMDFYWSSTSFNKDYGAGGDTNAWIVDFFNGSSGILSKDGYNKYDFEYSVRCVRNGE